MSHAHQDLPDTRCLTLRDASGLSLDLMDRGATWYSCRVPVRGEDGPREVLLGGASPALHCANTAYLGATVGRYANRIAGSRIERDGQVWPLVPQAGSAHQLHGGPEGFDRRRWAVIEHGPDHARFALVSPDGDQGFPGELHAEVSVHLPGDGVIEQTFQATTSAPTPVCLTNHAYFNLDGDAGDIRRHALRVPAGRYLPVDEALIPLGPLAPVAGTRFDFRTLRLIGAGDADAGAGAGAYDHAFLLDGLAEAAREADDVRPIALQPAAELRSGDGRLCLAIDTSMAALQVYTGAFLGSQNGRDGRPMNAHAGIALEPQCLPDSPHHPEWPQPSCWLQPGQVWRQRIRYQFRTADIAP
jgi:aldose 1-epimerase